MSLARRVRHRLELALVRLAQGLDRLLGPRLSGGLAAALGRFVHGLGIRRDVVDRQLLAAFPERDARWRAAVARSSYEHLGREGMTLLRLARLGPEDVIAATDVEGLDALREAAERGSGAVLVTGHLGNWEIGGAAVAARGLPLDVVAQPQANPLFDRLINDARERLGMTVVRKGGAVRASIRSLRKGRIVALVADQDARSAGVLVPFFGRPASTQRGPAVLAVRTGAPVFMGTAVRRSDGRYSVTVRRIPVPAIHDPEERADRLTAALAAALESSVRESPGQYLWQHRRWKTKPGSGARVLGTGRPSDRYDDPAGGGDERGFSGASGT